MPNCTEEEIKKILSACEKNNPSLDITGVLLYSELKFIQLVEGESKTLNMLYDKIKLDKRHEKVFMLSYGPIKEKSFPSWHMGSRKISESEIDFQTEISVEDKKVFNKLLDGKEESGVKILEILKKFFIK